MIARRVAMSVLIAIAATAPAHADDGDAAAVAARKEVEVAVIVTAGAGVKLGAARKATIAVSKVSPSNQPSRFNGASISASAST